MPSYHYTAVNYDGITKEGELEADAEVDVVHQLQESGYVPIKIQSNELNVLNDVKSPWIKFPKRQHISQDVIEFTRNLATLLTSGLPLERALKTLYELTEKNEMAVLVNELRHRVREGTDFASALQAHSKVFSNLYVSLVRAGELVGSLELIVSKLADYLERSKELKDSISSALIYPILLLVVTLISVLTLMIFIVPRFSQMFEEASVDLPMSTQFVINSGEWLVSYGWMMLLLGMLGALLLRSYLANLENRLSWDEKILRIPVLGEIFVKIEMARFSYALSLLINNGIPLLKAMSITQNVVNNKYIKYLLEKARKDVEEGKKFSDSLKSCKSFPILAVNMISVGEESGKLGSMLGRVADTYDLQVRTSLQRAISLLEPVLIIGLGLLVAFVIISILMAVLSMNEMVL